MGKQKANYKQIKHFIEKWIYNVGDKENLAREVVNKHFFDCFHDEYDYLMLQLVLNDLKIKKQF